MSIQEDKGRDIVRMEYLCELVAVQGESLAKNLRELADIGERYSFTQESLTSVRNFADAVDAVRTLANMKGGAE